MDRLESITRIEGPPTGVLAPGVELRVLATGALGSEGLTTALATFASGAVLPYHRHPFSEVIIVVSGSVTATVEGRCYRLGPLDALHIPEGMLHLVRNVDAEPATLHSSFASATPVREEVPADFPLTPCKDSDGSPETLVRSETAAPYDLAPNASFRDLFGGRFGARGICGGYGRFQPGASLPCHYHHYDESITIVEGEAVCQVAGREYPLSGCGTACIPRGRPHRFLNRGSGPMAMIWVYAGDNPERTLVDASCCAAY